MRILLICTNLIFFLHLGCSPKETSQEARKADKLNEEISEPKPAPAPGTVIAKVRITYADKSHLPEMWLLGLEVIEITGYGANTKPLPARLDSVAVPLTVMNHSQKSSFHVDEEMTLILSSEIKMDAFPKNKSEWSVIQIN